MTARNPALQAQHRRTDEIVLDMCALRHAGRSAGDIARLYHVTPNYVRTATNNVRAADEAAEGRDLSAHYWPTDKGRRVR